MNYARFSECSRINAQRPAVSKPALTVSSSGLLLALPSAATALLRGFDGLYGQDAYAYFDYSTGSVRQSLMHLVPLEGFFWPPGYPLLVAVTSFAVGPSALAGQLASLIMGALVPVWTALLVRELWPDDLQLALLAGAIVALCGQLWQSSVVVMADTTGLACATFAAFALARYMRTDKGGWLVAASAGIAYATLARWIYGLVAVPFAVYALAHLYDRRHWIHAGLGIAVAALVLVPTLGGSITGLLSHPDEQATFAGNFQVYSWSPLNAFNRDFETIDGHLQYTLPNGVYYAIAPANLAFMGPLFAVGILVGLYAARRWSLTTSVLLIGWAAIAYAFHSGAPWQNFRFTLAYLPPLAILSAAGALTVRRLLQDTPRRIVTVAIGLGLLVSLASAVRLEKTFIDRKDEELGLVRWVSAELPPQGQLLTFGPTLAFRHYTNIPTFDLFEMQRAEDLDAVLTSASPRYVLVDETSVETQWIGRAPFNNFHRIQNEVGLTPIGTDQTYTLYRVGAT